MEFVLVLTIVLLFLWLESSGEEEAQAIVIENYDKDKNGLTKI